MRPPGWRLTVISHGASDLPVAAERVGAVERLAAHAEAQRDELAGEVGGGRAVRPWRHQPQGDGVRGGGDDLDHLRAERPWARGGLSRDAWRGLPDGLPPGRATGLSRYS